MIAPPAPCATRNATIHASARLPFGVSPHSADAPANTATPRITIRLWPTVSASRPPKAKSAASERRYALTAHCTPVLVRSSSFWMFGTAIETIVWSMNVIDTAKIIAARIRFRDRPPTSPVVVLTVANRKRSAAASARERASVGGRRGRRPRAAQRGARLAAPASSVRQPTARISRKPLTNAAFAMGTSGGAARRGAQARRAHRRRRSPCPDSRRRSDGRRRGAAAARRTPPRRARVRRSGTCC